MWWYDVFLAQMESFSMLCSCITNLHTFQHGHSGYLGAPQKTSGLNDTSGSDNIFLTSRTTKSANGCEDFRFTSVKAVWKHSTSFPFLDVGHWSCLYRHPLEIQPDCHFTLTGRPLRVSSSRLSLPSRKLLCHLKITAFFSLYSS